MAVQFANDGVSLTNAGGAYQVPNITGLTINDFSLAYQVYIDTLTNGHQTFGFENYPTTPRNSFLLRPKDGTNMRISVIVDDTGSAPYASGFAMSAGQWYTVVLTRSGTTAKCYVDGIQRCGDVTVGSGSFSAFENLKIGCSYNDGRYLDGRFAHCAIWDKALDDAERAAFDSYVSPMLIAPGNLVMHAPLTDVNTKVGEMIHGTLNDVSSTGTPVKAPHTNTTQPSSQILQFPSVAAPATFNPGWAINSNVVLQ